MAGRKGRQQIRTEREALSVLAHRLRTAASRPSIHGYVPHGKQMGFHSSQALKRGLFGGNRSGKTVAGSTEGVFRATGKHPLQHVKPPPTKGRVVAVDFNYGVEQIVKPEYARWIPPSELINGSWEDSWDSTRRTLTLANGSTIEFMSYEQDIEKFAGTSRDWIHFDEEPPKAIFTECWMRVVDVRGCIWMTMTPLEGMTWVYDEIYLAARTDPQVDAFEIDIHDNPYLNQGEIDMLLSGLTSEEREARAHGRFVQIGGLIYKMFGEANLLDPFLPPKEWLHVAGMDHGFNNPTAWLWAAVSPDGTMVVFDEYYQSDQIVSYHAGKVHEINRNHDRLPDYYVGDPSIKNVDPITGTSIQIEYIDNGIPVLLGNNDVHAGILRVATLLTPTGPVGAQRPRLYFTRNCSNAIFEHARYRWQKWAVRKHNEERNKKEEPVKKGDHTCDAVRYIASSRPQIEDGQSIPENRGSRGASESVSPYAEVRADTSDTQPESYDDTLGIEW